MHRHPSPIVLAPTKLARRMRLLRYILNLSSFSCFIQRPILLFLLAVRSRRLAMMVLSSLNPSTQKSYKKEWADSYRLCLYTHRYVQFLVGIASAAKFYSKRGCVELLLSPNRPVSTRRPLPKERHRYRCSSPTSCLLQTQINCD